MLYDILIASLTVLGVVGTLVYSYKIARSRVCVVGLVHELDSVEKSAAPNSSVTDIDEKAIPAELTAVSALQTKEVLAKKTMLLTCPKCKTKNFFDPYPWNFKGTTKCAGCAAIWHIKIANGIRVAGPEEASGTPDLLPGFAERQDYPATIFGVGLTRPAPRARKAFEKRLRLLELESVHKMQELPDERALSDRQEFVN